MKILNTSLNEAQLSIIFVSQMFKILYNKSLNDHIPYKGLSEEYDKRYNNVSQIH